MRATDYPQSPARIGRSQGLLPGAMLALVAAALATTSTSSAGEKVPSFKPSVEFDLGATGTYPFGMAAGNLNTADSNPDLVVTNSGVNMSQPDFPMTLPGTVSILRNTGNWDIPANGLVLVDEIQLPAGSPTEVALGDYGPRHA